MNLKLRVGLGVGVFLALLAGCGDDQTAVQVDTPVVLTGLSTAEKNALNILRNQDSSISGVTGSTVQESSDANESAIFHTGYLASMTSAGQASSGGTIENSDSLPLATDTGSAPQDPPNRLSEHGSRSLPDPGDTVLEYYLEKSDDYASTDGYVADASGNPSRVLTMWYSRTGRRLLQRNRLSLFGFGSVAQAQSFDLRVPNPPNNTFLNGDFLATFVLVYDSTRLLDSPGIWPYASSQGSVFDVHQFSTDNDGTGCPISTHGSVAIATLDDLRIDVWDGATFAWVGSAHPFTLWAASDIRTAGTVLTNLTLSFSADANYLSSEFCLVPDTPLPVGIYRMQITLNNSLPSGDSAEWFFKIVP